MNLDFTPLIAKRRARFEELEKAITDPSLFDDAKKAREVLKEHARVKELLTTWDELESSRIKMIDDLVASGFEKPKPIKSANLEDVFINLTGKEMRAE